jgi:hypothetical protein
MGPDGYRRVRGAGRYRRRRLVPTTQCGHPNANPNANPDADPHPDADPDADA